MYTQLTNLFAGTMKMVIWEGYPLLVLPRWYYQFFKF